MLEPIQFNSVSDISLGPGTSSLLGEKLRQLGVTNVMMVTDPIIVELNLLDTALKSLLANNIGVTLFQDVVADPPESTVLAALEKARMSGCDGVVGFGGGSSMDVAKLLAVLLVGKQQLADMYGVDQITSSRVPLVQVPTTAGTGSEATMVSIITTGETTKAGVVSRQLLADTILLDPSLTLGLPPAITAATGIDAIVHAIEAYTSKRLKNPFSDMLAKQALQFMSSNIATAVKQGDNLPAREAMMVGAMLAGQAFANAPVAAVHALAYPLGGNYHIPHGLSNALVLPHVLRFNASAAEPLYEELAAIILPALQDDPQASTIPISEHNSASENLAQCFLAMAADFSLPTRLRDMDIAEEALPQLADEAMDQQRLLINNPRDVERQDALAIYQAAF